jgi:hypothetical protein
VVVKLLSVRETPEVAKGGMCFSLKTCCLLEWMKREQKIRPIYECRYDERLNTEEDENKVIVCLFATEYKGRRPRIKSVTLQL